MFDAAMSESLDRWITGNYGDDDWRDTDEEENCVDEFDPRYDEPLDFGDE